MTQFGHRAVLCGVGLALGIAGACAGKRGATKDPNQCMRKCDQDKCAYKAQSVSDNADYLECLRACEDECNIGGDEAEAE
jgi:hypothetical protein